MKSRDRDKRVSLERFERYTASDGADESQAFGHSLNPDHEFVAQLACTAQPERNPLPIQSQQPGAGEWDGRAGA